MAIPFTKFTTRKWAVLTSKIDKLLIGIGITLNSLIERKAVSQIQSPGLAY
jgi:hypothetical protein